MQKAAESVASNKDRKFIDEHKVLDLIISTPSDFMQTMGAESTLSAWMFCSTEVGVSMKTFRINKVSFLCFNYIGEMNHD